MESVEIFTEKFWNWFNETLSAEDRERYFDLSLPLNIKRKIELSYWAKYPYGRINKSLSDKQGLFEGQDVGVNLFDFAEEEYRKRKQEDL